MTNATATKIAVWAIEKEIKRLAVQANLHDQYHADAPACVQASARRKELKEAIVALKQPQQVRF